MKNSHFWHRGLKSAEVKKQDSHQHQNLSLSNAYPVSRSSSSARLSAAADTRTASVVVLSLRTFQDSHHTEAEPAANSQPCHWTAFCIYNSGRLNFCTALE